MELHEKQGPQGTGGGASRSAGGSPAEVPAAGQVGLPDAEERALVERARGGDRDAFRILLETHQDRVFRLALRVLRCDRSFAEDMVQEVFLRVFRGLPRFDGGVRFTTWLSTIAMNTCLTEYRKRKSLKRGRPTYSIDRSREEDAGGAPIEPDGRELDPGERVQQQEFAGAVQQAVDELPDEFRHAVLLRDLEGLSYEEIASILEVPVGTVRSRIHRGRLILQDKLGDFAP